MYPDIPYIDIACIVYSYILVPVHGVEIKSVVNGGVAHIYSYCTQNAGMRPAGDGEEKTISARYRKYRSDAN
jgi:hypothetical protein